MRYEISIKGEEDILIASEEIYKLRYKFDTINDNFSLAEKEFTLELHLEFLNDPNDDTKREKSKLNLIKFINWINSENKLDYREITIKVILSDKDSLEYVINNIFIDYMEQDFLDKAGNIYSICFKQQYGKNKFYIKNGENYGY